MKHFFNFELFSEDLVKAFCFLPSDELEGEEKYLYTLKRNKIIAACATCLLILLTTFLPAGQTHHQVRRWF